MKAVQLAAVGRLEMREVPLPQLPADGLLVRVRAAAICESDLHLYRGGEPCPLPLTLGHEIAGEVMDRGAAVTCLVPGDRVTLDTCIICGECRLCLSGRPELCRRGYQLGFTVDGGFAEYVAVPAGNAYLLPEWVSFEAASLAEPYGCALHALRRARLAPGEDVLILGDGFFGLVFTQLARALGARQVALLGHHQSRLQWARAEGADAAMDERAANVAEMAAAMTEGYGPAVVIDTVGTPTSLNTAIELAGFGGRLVMFGASADCAPIPSRRAQMKELDILGSISAPLVWPEIVSLMARRHIHPERLISKAFPLADLEKAFRLKAGRDPAVLKLVVWP